MNNEIALAPPHSIIFIMDAVGGKIPDSFNGELVSTTPTCIAVGTLSEQDGDTKITLTDDAVDPGKIINSIVIFEGFIEKSTDYLSVFTAFNDQILSLPIMGTRVKIKIWADSISEPSHITIFANRLNGVD